MKTTVNWFDFRNAFEARSRTNHFSYEGLSVLFDYLEQYENDCEVELELDVIGFCCEYGEYNLTDLNKAYNQEFTTLEEAEAWLLEVTQYCGKTDKTVVFCTEF
jgi:hypothetical protein